MGPALRHHLADGTTIGLTYEPTPGHTANTTGRLEEITLPQGGTITYAYPGVNNGIDCTYIVPLALTRTLGNGDVTSYSIQRSGPSFASNDVVDPGGNWTVYSMDVGGTGTNGGPGTNSVVTGIARYQGTVSPGNLLLTELYTYNTAFTTSPSTSGFAPAAVTKMIVYRQPKGMSNWSAVETHFDAYGNVTYKAEYDYGASSPTRATTITYGSCTASCATASPTISNTAMAANHIFDRPGEVVTAQNGVNVAQANYTYNSTGQMTSKQVWTGSAFIGQTSPNTYNTNGTPSAVFDLANNETDFTYASGGYYDNCTGITQYPFPTKVKNVGTGLYTQATYDCQGGVKLTDVDANGNTTTYAYTNGSAGDPYWRVTGITDPYSAVVYETYPTSWSSTTSGSSFTFNSSNSIEGGIATTDAYDRLIDAQMYQSPSGSNYDTVSTSYGWSGSYSQVQTSEPCSTTSGGTCTTVHTAKIDPLGRLITASTTSNETLTHTYTQNDDLAVLTPTPTGENAKQVQTEYDGLGRVKSECGIMSSGGYSSCTQSNGTYSGVFTTYAYTSAIGSTTGTVTRGSQVRSNTLDGLGRATSSTSPEGGTITNVYDSLPTACNGRAAAYPGKLIYSALANGNFSCYVYDSLGRVAVITGVSGSNTLCRRFFYDNSSGVLGSIPSGITLANQYGRMVEAETDTCASPVTSSSMITDEWFRYDKDGNPTDMWELTPHSTQYYHSTATFAGNGVITSLQLVSPSLYTINYTLDGEGRWNTLAKGSSTMITGPTQMYNAAGQPTEVDLTGTDKDTYTYDPNTGNMTKYVFQVGSANETGVLTWNPNNTLQQLAITDGFNSGGSQTCASSYDDLVRLTVFDCGSGNWGQDFGYDQYDNLAQTVISGRSGSTWNPGYNSSNNQVTGATYDASGDMTNDGGMNVYGYDSFNKVAWTAGSGTPTCGTSGKCITYDALGRMVEKSSGSAWTEIWYTQVPGSLVNMSGTVANYGYWPSPG